MLSFTLRGRRGRWVALNKARQLFTYTELRFACTNGNHILNNPLFPFPWVPSHCPWLTVSNKLRSKLMKAGTPSSPTPCPVSGGAHCKHLIYSYKWKHGGLKEGKFLLSAGQSFSKVSSITNTIPQCLSCFIF